jgi:hypothetical protein
MLHELLLALIGQVGGIIEERQGEFSVRNEVDFFTISEKQLINKILKVAAYYKYLDTYTRKFGKLSARVNRNAESVDEPGLYIKALCRGIKDLLDEYRSKVCMIEQHYLEGRTVTVPSLMEKMHNDDLEVAYRIVQMAESQSLRGAQILDLVINEEKCPSIRSTVSRLSSKLQQILTHQLISWIVYGHLLDSFGEFFIQEQEGDEWTSRFTLNLDMIPESIITPSLAEKILFIGKAVRVLDKDLPASEIDQFTNALRKVQDSFSPLLLSQVIEKIKKTVNIRLWNLLVVKSDLLGHLTALKNYFLLGRGEFFHEFLSESVDMLNYHSRFETLEKDLNEGPFTQAQSSLEEDTYLTNFKLILKQTGFDFSDFSLSNNISLLGCCKRTDRYIRLVQNRQSRRAGAIWHTSKQAIGTGFSTEFTFRCTPPATLHFMLQSEKEVLGENPNAPISPAEIENGLSVRVNIMTGQVHVTLQVNDSKLAEGMCKTEATNHSVRIIFFEDNFKVDIDNTVCINKQMKLAGLKLDVGGTAYVGISSQSSIELTRWVFSEAAPGIHPASSNPWSGLTLEYSPVWPLNLLLSQQILDKYRALFRFLFTLRRSQYMLQKAWLHEARKKNMNHVGLLLRAQMSFIVDNFMAYFQLDVIQAQFLKFQKLIGESEDFEEVRKYHDQYVASIAQQCFLHVPKIVRAVQEIARVSIELCTALETGDNIDELRRRFESESHLIFKILSSIKNQHSSLGQLLLRLDYNKYFSKARAAENGLSYNFSV